MKRKHRKMLKEDIKLCEYAINNPEKSCEIYNCIVAKYSVFDETFSDRTMYVHSLDGNYTNEIKAVKYKLQAYLEANYFPIKAISDNKRVYKYCNFGNHGQISDNKKIDIAPRFSLFDQDKGEN